MNQSTTEIATIDPAILPAIAQEYKIFSPEAAEAIEVMQVNTDGDTMSVSDLPRVKCPSGGGVMWELPETDDKGNPDTVKELDGIILFAQYSRAYWEKEYGTKDASIQPDCSSYNGLEGVGNPGGLCQHCPLNAYETASKGSGKACKEFQILFFLRQGDILPTVLRVPPASLKNFKRYRTVTLTNAVAFMHNCLTRMTLTKTKNDDGVEYAEINFEMLEKLPREVKEFTGSMSQMLQPLFKRIIESGSAYDGAND